MGLGKRFTQPFRCLRNEYQMNMIGHQAISPAFRPSSIASLGYKTQINLVVISVAGSPAALHDEDTRAEPLVEYVAYRSSLNSFIYIPPANSNRILDRIIKYTVPVIPQASLSSATR